MDTEFLLRRLPPIGGSIARVSIAHSSGMYLVDDVALDLSKSVILLGAFIRRVMWPPAKEGSTGLECSSNDGEFGRPTLLFPAISVFREEEVHKAQSTEEFLLPCSACDFVNWRDKQHPRCTVQITVPMLLQIEDDEMLTLASMSYQRSAEKPIRQYMREFTAEKRPAYSTTTRLRLNVNLGSGFKYSTPTFSRDEPVGVEAFPVLSAIYNSARKMLTAPPPLPTPREPGGFFSSGIPAGKPVASGAGFFS